MAGNRPRSFMMGKSVGWAVLGGMLAMAIFSCESNVYAPPPPPESR